MWTTVMIERWKRKECHIAYKWGIVSESSTDESIRMNPDFLGFQKFSWSSNNFLGKESANLSDRLYIVLNVIISLLLMLTSVVAEVFLKSRAIDIGVHQ